MERVRRRPRHRVPKGRDLTGSNADNVREWAKHAHGSPLYSHLIGVLAEDSDLLEVIGRIEHLPQPNILFAGVQYLIFKGDGPQLADYYASMVDEPLEPDGVDAIFKRFVLDHSDELLEIGRTRYTQTNECRRCAVLMPLVWLAPFDRFHLIDIGTSAGLNLALDRYRYRWNDLEWGPAEGVGLNAEVRGMLPVPRDVEIISRTGLDLHPVDPTDPDDCLWLDALIWPEHRERRARFRAALAQMAGIPVSFVGGDALETLGRTLAALPEGDPAVVMNSFALNQFEEESRVELEEVVRRGRDQRPIHRVSVEILNLENQWARLLVDDGSGFREVGQAHPHGEWLEVYARP